MKVDTSLVSEFCEHINQKEVILETFKLSDHEEIYILKDRTTITLDYWCYSNNYSKRTVEEVMNQLINCLIFEEVILIWPSDLNIKERKDLEYHHLPQQRQKHSRVLDPEYLETLLEEYCLEENYVIQLENEIEKDSLYTLLLNSDSTCTPETAQKMIDQILEGKFGKVVTTTTITHEKSLIGCLFITNFCGKGLAGHVFINKVYQNNGLAKAMAIYGIKDFYMQGYRTLIGSNDVDNYSSQGLCKSVGMTKHGFTDSILLLKRR